MSIRNIAIVTAQMIDVLLLGFSFALLQTELFILKLFWIKLTFYQLTSLNYEIMILSNEL